jgi:hypothetical protein
LQVAGAARSARTICVRPPRDFDQPADLVGAVAVIALGGEPSGDPSPSAQDGALTRRLIDAGKLFGIALLDHIVWASDGALHSLRDGLAHASAPRHGPDPRWRRLWDLHQFPREPCRVGAVLFLAALFENLIAAVMWSRVPASAGVVNPGAGGTMRAGRRLVNSG